MAEVGRYQDDEGVQGVDANVDAFWSDLRRIVMRRDSRLLHRLTRDRLHRPAQASVRETQLTNLSELPDMREGALPYHFLFG
jgi:hypothetical protein